ncbi:Serine/threonine-protein kinase PknB [Novipirellula aureliae]|uniref:Serine/threonine-protein kinase PknB n=1 Tax=Novipirellula aureliae TaxID=2527966 RepID=A0A5C6E552_9BACT|nr:serine/threonine-protein kinase [Novipirellula aureliae]TWU43980.1 Serine/threonine-protein kinase PknB [Novipirellula aureliae]
MSYQQTLPNSFSSDDSESQIRKPANGDAECVSGFLEGHRHFIGGLGRHQLGDYIIKRQIGRGGMGVVYEAEQISLGRRVALKTLPFASVLDPKQVIRFKNEAQAAAGLHHPNIVPVYGVGNERGVHYFSMQLIQGQSLDEVIRELIELADHGQEGASDRLQAVCNDTTADACGTTETVRAEPRKPTVSRCFSTCKSVQEANYVRSVAELGKHAADALHYAHEHGVIHRDIKPSNLMLDRQGKLWITDFGLARITNSQSITVSGDLIGTARYMSPEQAGGRLHEIDHRSDVFSLGATLYEMLTLTPAFHGESREQLLRAVEFHGPESPRKRNPSIHVDLETILLKSLEKRRDDRYATAGELADDLANFLEGRPPKAKRPGPMEHAFRFAARHRNWVVAGFLVLCLLLAVVSTSAMLLNQQRQKTIAESALASEHLRETQRVVDNFGALVDQRLEHIAGTQRLRIDLLRELEKYYESFVTKTADQPSFDLDLATTRFRLGAVHQRLGEHELSRDFYLAALAGFERLRHLAPESNELIADVALCHNNLGQVADSQGDFSVAREEYELSIAGYRQLVLRGAPRGRTGFARTSMNLGLLLASNNDPDAARVLEQSLESLTALASRDPENLNIQDQLALCENNLASVVLDRDRGRAEHLLRRAVKRYNYLADRRPASPEHKGDRALAISNLAAVLATGDDRKSAIYLLEEVVELRRSLVESEPDVMVHATSLVMAYHQRGQLFATEGDIESAINEYDLAKKMLEQTMLRFPLSDRLASDMARTLSNLAVLSARIGKSSEAISMIEEAIEHEATAIRLAPGDDRYIHLMQHHQTRLAELKVQS